ncbi:His-Xaa-Ser system protein HxsD [Gilvimarinus japonicus]|uniref:His-Xaa-Ser system protein HxsD n=1 Tax=Gilvimarinus japonicus TaxID=1796469 RepID=A0ABV7HRG7_9GAMM
MERIRLKKTKYSEWVVRNSLYWLSAVCDWDLEEGAIYWDIQVTDNIDIARTNLAKHLNDYLLREQLASRSSMTRQAIIQNVLAGIEKRLSP